MTDEALQKIIEEIIVELRRISDVPMPYHEKEDGFPFPRMIATGDDSQILISKKIDLLITRIANIKMRADGGEGELRRRHYSENDMRSLIRRSFGPALAKIDLGDDLEKISHTVLSNVLADIASAMDRVLSSQREYTFGCDLFFYKDIGPLDIGPVRFEPREIWLQRKASDGRWARIVDGGQIERFSHKIADGPISPIAKRRIMHAWKGEKLRKRRPSYDSWFETDILRAIGDSAYVCSVRTEGLDGVAGQKKALLAARLALSVLALRWERPSNALTQVKLAPDRPAGYRQILSFTPEGLMSTEGIGTKLRGESWSEREQVEQSLIKLKDIFDVFGKSLYWLLSPSKSSGEPKLFIALLHSLIMFYEGCTSELDQLAVSKFVSALDILTEGEGQAGVKDLLCICFSIEASERFTSNELTIDNFVQQIYSKGRSKMFHGGNRTLDHDWSGLRALAEWVTRYVLIFCAEQAGSNPDSGQPKKVFLKGRKKPATVAQLKVRIHPELHNNLTEIAEAEGKCLDEWIAEILAREAHS